MLKRSAVSTFYLIVRALPGCMRLHWKSTRESRYWREALELIATSPDKVVRKRAQYEYLFTDFFGFTKADYEGLRMLDVGCGPWGSLEWAHGAAVRVGLDPLVPKNRDDTCDEIQTAMTYCEAAAEKIPFPNGFFDVVSCFDTLDRVGDVELAIGEMKRVTSPLGRILLIVAIEYPPKATEPRLDEEVLDRFAPEFVSLHVRIFSIRKNQDVYRSLLERLPYERGRGVLAVRLERSSHYQRLIEECSLASDVAR